jgi:hypothetical protein
MSWQLQLEPEPVWWCEVDELGVAVHYDTEREMWSVSAADLNAIGARHLLAWYDGQPSDDRDARSRAVALVAAWRRIARPGDALHVP